MIEEFYVNNYKCLVDVRLPLTPMHVIIGQNDSGKTSLLEAMLAAIPECGEVRSPTHFPASGRIANWCMPARRRPSSSSRSVSVRPRKGPLPAIYHLEVEFGSGRSCRRIDEWFENRESHSHQ